MFDNREPFKDPSIWMLYIGVSAVAGALVLLIAYFLI